MASFTVILRYSQWFETIQKGVKVTSSPGMVTVMVQDYAGHDTSAYMALPLRTLSTSYFAVTFYNGGNLMPGFLVIGIADSTSVNIFYKLKSDVYCGSNKNGEKTVHTLGAHDVYGIKCSGDFTGTYISSDKPIAVIAGHPDLTLYSDAVGSDTVQEMLLPVKHFGHSFVLFTHHAWDRGSVNRVVAAYDNTRVTSGAGATDLQAGHYIDLDTDVTGQLCLTSNRPIQVVMFGKSFSSATTATGDTFMSNLLSTNTFSDSVHLKFPLADMLGVSEFINVAIIVDKNDIADIPMGSQAVHEGVSGCNFEVYTQEISWPFSNEVGGFRFGAYIYGTYWKKYSGFGFPLVMNVDGDVCLLPCLNGNCTWNGTEYICLCEKTYFGPQCSQQVSVTTTATTTDTGVVDVSSIFPSPVEEIASSSSSQRTPENPVSTRPSIYPENPVSTRPSIYPENPVSTRPSIYPENPVSTTPSIYPENTASTTLFSSPAEYFESSPENGNVLKNNTLPASPYFSTPPSSVSSSLVVSSVKLSLIFVSAASSSSPAASMLASVPSSEEEVTTLKPSHAFDGSSSSSRVHVISSQLLTTTLIQEPLSSAITPLTEPSDDCGCLCFEQKDMEVDEELIQKVKKKIRKELLVETWNLSRTIRMKTSAQDGRPSAVGVGSLGVFLLCLVGTVIFVPDILTFVKSVTGGSARYRHSVRIRHC